jgi:DNA repair protein RecO (recombination protein O)
LSYHIYTTKGLILSERPLREADRLYSILTRDLGLVRATALGVRKEASKLRGALEPVSLSTVSLVRGKEHWRLTSAEFLKSFKKSKPLVLLEQLVAGEAVHPELFDAVEKHLESDETTLVAQILYHLGYLKSDDLNLPEKDLIKAINQGLQASHLS